MDEDTPPQVVAIGESLPPGEVNNVFNEGASDVSSVLGPNPVPSMTQDLSTIHYALGWGSYNSPLDAPYVLDFKRGDDVPVVLAESIVPQAPGVTVSI
jgi:hypothetical protein